MDCYCLSRARNAQAMIVKKQQACLLQPQPSPIKFEREEETMKEDWMPQRTILQIMSINHNTLTFQIPQVVVARLRMVQGMNKIQKKVLSIN